VPGRRHQQAIDAALDCPGECIFIEIEEGPPRRINPWAGGTGLGAVASPP
jgi:hypothetical protein